MTSRIRPVLAGAMMIAAALSSASLVAIRIRSTIAIALAGMLVLAAIFLFLEGRSSRLVGLITTGIGAAGYIYLFIELLPLMRMGAASPLVCLILLVGAVLSAVALVVLLMWREDSPTAKTSSMAFITYLLKRRKM